MFFFPRLVFFRIFFSNGYRIVCCAQSTYALIYHVPPDYDFLFLDTRYYFPCSRPYPFNYGRVISPLLSQV